MSIRCQVKQWIRYIFRKYRKDGKTKGTFGLHTTEISAWCSHDIRAGGNQWFLQSCSLWKSYSWLYWGRGDNRRRSGEATIILIMQWSFQQHQLWSCTSGTSCTSCTQLNERKYFFRFFLKGHSNIRHGDFCLLVRLSFVRVRHLLPPARFWNGVDWRAMV